MNTLLSILSILCFIVGLYLAYKFLKKWTYYQIYGSEASRRNSIEYEKSQKQKMLGIISHEEVEADLDKALK